MSVGKLIATPELRAMFDAWFAKFAAPGMCNPEDQSPTVTTEPTDDVTERDARSLPSASTTPSTALVRGRLGDPKLGRHNGLPVTVIVTATMQDLQSRTGHGRDRGRHPASRFSDLIRMSTPAYHYLAVFDGVTGKALWLGSNKRIATGDQRIILLAKDRGCTRPGVTPPATGAKFITSMNGAKGGQHQHRQTHPGLHA